MDLNTGKYAFYIWTSYGATALVLAALIGDTLWRSARWKREAARLEAEKAERKAAK